MRREYDFSRAKRGAVVPSRGKTRITIFIDNDVLAAFRARAESGGIGYQTLMNEALRASMAGPQAPLTEETLRHVLRQELPAYLPAAEASRSPEKRAKPSARRRS